MTREAFPDQLRGVALLGIVLVNAPSLLDTLYYFPGADRAWWDAAAAGLIRVLLAGKSYLVFAFLFGYGAAILLARASNGRFRRRLLGLGVLGALHFAGLFWGDILLLYAVVGLALPRLARLRRRGLLRVAAAAWALSIGTTSAYLWVLLHRPQWLRFPVDGDYDAAMAGSAVLPMIRERLGLAQYLAITLSATYVPLVLAAFAVGLAVGRVRGLADPAAWARGPLARRLSRVALLVGLPLAVAGMLLERESFGEDLTLVLVGYGITFCGAPLLSAGYVVWLARLSLAGRLAWAAPAGRMTLSGYLGESLVLVVLASGWGFGLFGQLGALAMAGVAIGVFLLLDVLARVWSPRRGPMEVLLRAVS